MSVNSETNVAEILRDIAAASDAISGKIIKKAQKAADKGLGQMEVRISRVDYISLANGIRRTPPMERLESLGFHLLRYMEFSEFFGRQIYYLIVSW